MSVYTQAGRPLAVTTPLGEDVLLLARFRGRETISRLFSFEIDLQADLNAEIEFDRILGQSVTVQLEFATGEKRYWNGLVKRFSQEERDESFQRFSLELVPELWLLTKTVRSRIFQHVSVPGILRQLFAGLQVTYQLSSTYYDRDYCVQYRESDFNFASRLMEEEGMYYFFKHQAGRHELVVTDLPAHPSPVPGQSTVIYEELSGDFREEMRVTAWKKSQDLRSGEYTLWDHCFEMPGAHLEAQERATASVTAGKVVHKLDVGGNSRLEIYDYPGGYAQRFDGLDGHGAPRPEQFQQMLEDRDRTAKIRMEQEQATSIAIAGASDCAQFSTGHKFKLKGHWNADGEYLLTSVEHDARQSGYRSGEEPVSQYENGFTCVPGNARYRPARETAKPVIASIQTATVVGPKGEELFLDQYGRVKVQFHWDREGRKDVDSSCWLRVAQVWAGKRWGAFFWPRIGHEVVVAFEEGDPDQPMIVGSVYNAENMPPLVMPGTNMFCGIKSASVRGKAGENYNSVIFVDLKGQEHLAIHSERHMILNAEFDVASRAGRHHGQRVSGAHVTTVGNVPGGGGSGGGPTTTPPVSHDPTTQDSSSGYIWAQPIPQAVGGLSSSVVYGSAFQASVPLSMQVASGSLFKLVVDPAGFAAAFAEAPSGPLLNLLGSGLNGNVQVTLGTYANITMGLLYDIHVGPKKITLNSSEHPGLCTVTYIMGVIMGAVAIAFQIAYGLFDTDDERAILVITFQCAIQVLLAALMAYENTYYYQEETCNKLFKSIFGTDPADVDEFNVISVTKVLTNLLESLIGAGVGEAALLPPVIDSYGESKLRPLILAANKKAAQAAQQSSGSTK